MRSMAELFLKNIKIKECWNIKNFNIPISDTEKKHLIITGKNGSGKTSLLRAINTNLTTFATQSDLLARLLRIEEYDNLESKAVLTDEQKAHKHYIKKFVPGFGGVRLKFNQDIPILKQLYDESKYLIVFFSARREVKMIKPQGVNQIDLTIQNNTQSRLGQNFLQYIVNLKADRSFAKDDGEYSAVSEIDKWFVTFENFLRNIFNDEGLQLKFNRKEYNFDLISSDGSLFNFNTLSDGYASIISIITELIMRMESAGKKAYDANGLVIIDEVETHLHVDLQKKILPFLTSFFPNIQFIVTTHSPFVLSSISNAIICDLEHKSITSDLSAYSYDALVESYFDTDKYSEEIKSILNEYEKLYPIKDNSVENSMRFLFIKDKVENIPDFKSDEIQVKLQQIKMANLGK